MELISWFLRRSADNIQSKNQYWQDLINEQYGINVFSEDFVIIRQIYNILRKIPPSLIKSCNIKKIQMRDLGPNLPYYPSHGYFLSGSNDIVLNNNIFYHPDFPDDFIDHKGYFISRAEETLLHELAHSYDEYNGDLSLKNDWLSLSGWSKFPKPGLKKIIIREPGMPKKEGRWYYNPTAGFTRFYAKMDPIEDFADTFAFFVANLKRKIPKNKIYYFDKLLSKHYN